MMRSRNLLRLGKTGLRRLRHERGVSLVEVMVGIVILALALLSLSAASGLAARQLYYSRTDSQWSAAVQQKLEELGSQGFANVSNGSGVVQGYNMTWTVTGTDPKTVKLMVQRQTRLGQIVVDTLLMSLVAADSL